MTTPPKPLAEIAERQLNPDDMMKLSCRVAHVEYALKDPLPHSVGSLLEMLDLLECRVSTLRNAVDEIVRREQGS